MDKLAIFDFWGSFVFWNLAYITIIISGAVNKKSTQVGIPVFPVLVNFSWEIASVINPSYYIRVSWFALDCFIIYLIFKKQDLKNDRKRLCSYLAFLAVVTTIFFFIFYKSTLLLPISSFFIDTAMAIAFLIKFKKIDHGNRVLIGLLKFLGDTFVWIGYADMHFSISVFAAITFVCNIIYLIFAVKEVKAHPEINQEFKDNLINFLDEVKNLFKSMKRSRNKEIVHSKRRKKKKVKKTHR